MEDRIYLISLYDYYGELLTTKQKEYFEDYYYNNLTLSEISENNNVSRNAVYKCIKDVSNKLNFFEEKLSLYSKKNKILEILDRENKNYKEEIKELI